MSGKYLLDTNILIALFAEEKKVAHKITEAFETYVPSIVIGELYYGAFNSTKKEVNVEKIDNFRTEAKILACDDTTARFYGQTKSQLKKQGTTIPENDIWIAALAFQYDLVLITRDAHFNKVDGLKKEAW